MCLARAPGHCKRGGGTPPPRPDGGSETRISDQKARDLMFVLIFFFTSDLASPVSELPVIHDPCAVYINCVFNSFTLCIQLPYVDP